MKKLLCIAMLALGLTANAQEQTTKGKYLIETNTGFGAAHVANTGFYLSNVDGETDWSIGAEGGYFIMDDLALKLGLGYNSSLESFSYKLGAKYYVNSVIPVQVDYSGANSDFGDASYLGFQAGYAIFLGDKVSIEPGLRYNYGIGDSKDFNVFQLNVGFSLYL